MWWKRGLFLASLLSLATGFVWCYSTYSFLKSAKPVEATVVAIEYRQGPPKFRQSTPVHLRYTTNSGSEVQTVTHLPFLQSLSEGKVITVLANASDPQDVRLPLLSELFAVPLTYLLFGIIGVFAGLGLKRWGNQGFYGKSTPNKPPSI